MKNLVLRGCLAAVVTVTAVVTAGGQSAPRNPEPARPDDRSVEEPQGGNPESHRLDCGGGAMLELVLVPAGKFLVGSSPAEEDHIGNEGPQHEVTISRAFYMGIHEVTQRQWQAVMGSNPSIFKGAMKPVENVSWNEAASFCQVLSRRTNRKVRLPAEAEWEYACRAGSQTRFCFGDSGDAMGEYATYKYDLDDGARYAGTHPVGQKKPNAFGLYDMHGNVREWCGDWYGEYGSEKAVDPQGPSSGEFHVLRGGAWNDEPSLCRSAVRVMVAPGGKVVFVGCRVVVERE